MKAMKFCGSAFGAGLAPVRGMITDDDYLNIAETLIRRHGAAALLWADLAIQDLDEKGETHSATHWRALRGVIYDMVSDDEAPSGTESLLLH